MAHASKLCHRPGCTDLHPNHLSSGKISHSIRPLSGGLLMDDVAAMEIRFDPRFSEVTIELSQVDFDLIFQAGREDGLREGQLRGSALGWAVGYRFGEQTARESAARLF